MLIDLIVCYARTDKVVLSRREIFMADQEDQ